MVFEAKTHLAWEYGLTKPTLIQVLPLAIKKSNLMQKQVTIYVVLSAISLGTFALWYQWNSFGDWRTSTISTHGQDHLKLPLPAPCSISTPINCSRSSHGLPEHCIEENICKDLNNQHSDVYYYKRTNFQQCLSSPVNYKACIEHIKPVVPRKVHFVLFSKQKREFKFYYMIAILAASRYVKPEKIYLWHDNPPVGQYWKETKQRVKNLYLVHRKRPTTIYGRPVNVVEHASDIARLEILLEYGGMYFDTDSIVVNPVDPLLHYDITMGNAVPGAIANGIMFSKPWSDFHKIWHKQYKTFDDTKWATHSVLMAFKLSEKYPNLIHVEPTSLCRPHFQELPWLFGRKFYPWKKKNYVVHLYMRYSEGRGTSPRDIKNWHTTVGQIMRHIYYNKLD